MYTTASLQEGAIYDHISARGGLYTRQHFCKRGLYTRPHFCKRGLYTSPRGARNLDAVVGERRDLLHARHHHVLHLQAVAFGSLVSNGWFRMVGFEWLVSNGWFRMVAFEWLVSSQLRVPAPNAFQKRKPARYQSRNTSFGKGKMFLVSSTFCICTEIGKLTDLSRFYSIIASAGLCTCRSYASY